jgi:endonuclease/exonuclease/phosphatase (EEP) superfamily protein YafD
LTASPPNSASVVCRLVAATWRSAFIIALVLVLLAMFVSFAGRLGFPFNLACNFRVYYAIGSAVCLVGLLIGRGRRWTLIAGLALLANLILLEPVRPWGTQDGSGEVRLLIANVLTTNTDHDRLLGLINETDPDIIGLVEVNHRWLDALAVLDDRYPFQLTDPRADNFGMALFSKLPLANGRTEQFAGAGFNSIVGDVRVSSVTEPITIVLSHPPPPVRRAISQSRDEQLRALGQFIANQRNPVIVAGDFNATPWTPSFRDMVSKAELINARRGRGLVGTWPANLPPFLRLPIDHVLVTPPLAIVGFATPGSIGSDHLPLVVDVKQKPR